MGRLNNFALGDVLTAIYFDLVTRLYSLVILVRYIPIFDLVKRR